MGEIVTSVFERVVRDGITYLVRKAVNAAGKKIREFFRDEDDNGVPDTDEPEFTEDDDEEETSGEGETSGETSDTPDIPVKPPATTSETTNIGDVVLITPDGPVALYADSDEQLAATVSKATEQWVAVNGATNKPFTNYSVTEGLLFLIAIPVLFVFFRGLFKRGKF